MNQVSLESVSDVYDCARLARIRFTMSMMYRFTDLPADQEIRKVTWRVC